MRRLTTPRLALLALTAAGATAAGCASVGTPPGGPPDVDPPHIVAVAPDSGARNAHPKTVVFRFDETVSDRVSRGELDQYFLISPMEGAPRVSYHRSWIEVRPRRGFRDNTAYTVTLLPGLTDIRGNVSKETRSVTFATGAEIPRFGVLGRVFDWAAERPAVNAVVEAISRPDSTVYVALTDSLGAFSLGPLPAGRYTVYGWVDQNLNRARDRSEIWDSTTVSITLSRPTVELLAIARDTIAPRLQQVVSEDSVSLRLMFDRPLAQPQTFTTGQFRVVRSDSVPLSIVRVLTAAEADRARLDSTRVADSVRALTDTSRRQAPAPPQRQGTGRPVAAAPPKPHIPAPPSALVVRLDPATPLVRGGSYRVSVIDIRGIADRLGSSGRTLTLPRPDTSRAAGQRRAPADTLGARRPVRPPPRDTLQPPGAPVPPKPPAR